MPLIDKLLTATIKFLQKKQKSLRYKKKRIKKKAVSSRKRAAARKVKVRRKSTAKKAAKKKSVKRVVKKPAKMTKKKVLVKKKAIAKKKPNKLKKKVVSKVKKKESKKTQLKGKLIGEITHYFSRIGVVVIKLSKAGLSVGSSIQVIGPTTNFIQKVKSLQIESVDVRQAKKGELVGLKAFKKAKEGDKVYLVP